MAISVNPTNVMAKDRVPRIILRRTPYAIGFIFIGLGIAIVASISQGVKLAALVFIGWLILGCLAYAVRNFETALYLFAFVQPFEKTLLAVGINRYNTFTYVAMVLAFIGFLQFRQRSVLPRQTRAEILTVLWILWGCVTLYWSEDFDAGAGDVVTHIGGLMVLYIYSRGLRFQEEVLHCLWYYIAGTLIVSIILLGFYDRSAAFIWHVVRYIPSALALGTGISPAEATRACIISIFGALILWKFEKNRLYQKVAFLLAIFFGIIMLLTLIRSAVLTSAVALSIWVLFRDPVSHRIKKGVILFILFASSWYGAWLTNPYALEFRLNRTLVSYESGDSRSISVGRSHIWLAAWEVFREHPLEGVGLGSFSLAYSEQTGDLRRGDHNAYVKVFTETGLIGGLLFLGLIATLGWNAYRTGQWRSFTFPVWVAFAGLFMSQGLGRAKEFWIASAITLFLAKQAQAPATVQAKGVQARRVGVLPP